MDPREQARQGIEEMVHRETRAWDRQDAAALVELFHPDMVRAGWREPRSRRARSGTEPVDRLRLAGPLPARRLGALKAKPVPGRPPKLDSKALRWIYRLAKRNPVGLVDLQDEALIVPPQDRPHRVVLNQMLMNAGVSWHVAVEANGWDLMLHFAGLNVGLAIVNGCCRVPRGLVTRPLAELPKVRYQIVERAGAQLHTGAAALKKLLLTNRDAWRAGETHEC